MLKNIESRLVQMKELISRLKNNKESNSEILKSTLEIIAQLSRELTSYRSDSRRLEQYVNEIDDDLASLEQEIFSESNGEECCIQIKCSTCGDMVSVVKGMQQLASEPVVCPRCNQVLLSCHKFKADDEMNYRFVH